MSSSELGCLVIGYNDLPFDQHVARVSARGEDFPDYRIFMRDHLVVEGRPQPYMDVINTYVNASGRHPGIDSYYHIGEVPNLAAVYLANFLRRHGESAEFVSLFGAERNRVQALICDREPRVVAITTTFYQVPTPVAEIVQFVRELSSECTIVVGGPLIDNFATDLDGESLLDMLDWMGADVYVRESQGETTLLRIVEAVTNGQPLSSVANCYLPDGNTFSFTYAAPENNCLDQCTIDWRIFDHAELGATVQTRTARSCAFRCSFCDFPARAGALALASVDAVERELEQLAACDVSHLVFVDDTFNVPRKRFKELLRMMIRRDFGFRWYSFFRCTSSLDDETFDLMADSGCGGVFLGIESAHDHVLSNMDKSATVAEYRRGLDQLHQRDIVTFASFIVGFPGESDESIRSLIHFLNDSCPTFYRAEPFWYHHRSPIHRRALEFGLSGQAYNWRHSTMDIDGACDALDMVFDEVGGSHWIPSYNQDFWALPYLLGKGFTTSQLVSFHAAAQDVMRQNARPESAEAVKARATLKAVLDNVVLSPPRFRNPAGPTITTARTT
jgi:radical SAM PhpK family P-methyltransferase